MSKRKENIVTYAVALIIVLALSLLFNWLALLLWNWLMPMIFNLPELTFWQMYGFVFLLSLIFSFLGSARR